MKRLTIEILALFILFGCVREDFAEPDPLSGSQTRTAQSDGELSSDCYYGYEGKKEYLTKVPEKFFVIYKKDKAGSLTRSGASLAEASVSDYPLRASINKTAAEAAFAGCVENIIESGRIITDGCET